MNQIALRLSAMSLELEGCGMPEIVEALQIAEREIIRLDRPTYAVERIPTHRCKVCGCLWILWQFKTEPPSWSLGTNEKCGPCCDNVAMGDQIETLAEAYKRSAPQHSGDSNV
jgi:hypothetical protein